MTGLIPFFLASLTRSMVPAREPWSVSATAGICSSAARAARAGIRHAPSRIEYSEWTWRWTNEAVSGTARPLYKWVPTGPLGPAGWFGLGLVVVAVAHVGGREDAQMETPVGAEDCAGDGRPVLLEEGAGAVGCLAEERVRRRAVARPRARLAGIGVRRAGAARQRDGCRRGRATDAAAVERLRLRRRPRGRERCRERRTAYGRRRVSEARARAGQLLEAGSGAGMDVGVHREADEGVMAMVAAPRERVRRQRQRCRCDEWDEQLPHSVPPGSGCR